MTAWDWVKKTDDAQFDQSSRKIHLAQICQPASPRLPNQPVIPMGGAGQISKIRYILL